MIRFIRRKLFCFFEGEHDYHLARITSGPEKGLYGYRCRICGKEDNGP